MKTIALSLLAGVAMSAVATVAVAQQAEVPEKMPFDIPYGTPITLEHAMKVAQAAEAEAKKHNWANHSEVKDQHVGDTVLGYIFG